MTALLKHKRKGIKMVKNRQKTIYRVFLILTLVFGVMMPVIISMFDILGDSAPPLLFMSFFLAIVCLICTLIFRKRSRSIEHALKDKNYLAQWHFSPEKWKAFMEKDDQFRTGERTLAFTVLSVLTVIIFMMFVIFAEEGKLAMFLTMLGLIVLYALAAFIVPYFIRRFRKDEAATVLILSKGVLLNKQYHSWDLPLSKLASASFEKKPYEHVQITYEFVDRTGPRSYTINIPIPEDVEIKVVQGVVETLNRVNGING